MKAVKTASSLLILLFLIVHTILPSPVFAIENQSNNNPSNIPVWKVAWVTIPQVIVHIGGETHTVNFIEQRKEWFYNTAAKFKDYIEESTNYAVEIEIAHITVESAPVFTSRYSDMVSVDARLTDEIKEKYNIEDYDTWMVGWPFISAGTVESTYYDFNHYLIGDMLMPTASLALDYKELYILTPGNESYYLFLTIHEFLHTSEMWFGAMLGYEVPYHIYDINPADGLALHNPGYYGYGENINFSQVDWNFFKDWLSCKIRDPKYGELGHDVEYLGIPCEAWRQSPTNTTLPIEPKPGNDVPVWKVAWVIVPETTVRIGNEIGKDILTNRLKELFIKSSEFFEEFIEEHTENAVDIQITIIEVNIQDFVSYDDDYIYPKVTAEGKEKYNLDNYDTWLIGGPFRSRNYFVGPNEIYMQLTPSIIPSNDSMALDRLVETIIHEFLHQAESWFRDTLGFKLPYNVLLNGFYQPAVHIGAYYGYTLAIPDFLSEEWLEESKKLGRQFYIDWLSCKIRDPKYGEPGHDVEYLGIPREAWRQSPTNTIITPDPIESITVTFEPNNGTESISNTGDKGRFIQMPANPEPTEHTSDKIFDGWYTDEDFTYQAQFPWYADKDMTFYAKWSENDDIIENITVMWQPNNGAVAISDIVSKGTRITAPERPENTANYIFQGWYTDEEFTQKVNFPYIVVSSVTFYARWTSKGTAAIVPSDNQDAYINLENESLNPPPYFTIAAYSVDGGRKWKAGTILPANFPKLLNKELKLIIADKYDTRAKLPTSDATKITFSKINTRPKSNTEKLKPNYSVLADSTGLTPGAWILARNGVGSAVYEGYQMMLSSNGKALGGEWQKMPADGIAVQPNGAAKKVYFVRSAPVVDNDAYVPASKPFKVTPLTQGKASKIKADYKNETIKLRAGMTIFGGTAEQIKLTENNQNVESATAFDVGMYYTAKKSDSNVISIKAVLDATDAAIKTKQTVCIWLPATDKKPSTQIQEYTLAIRAETPATVKIAGVNGKAKLPSTLEFYDSSKNRWGSLATFTSSGIFENSVRVKASVKATGTDDSSGLAASKEVALSVEYGSYTTGKNGILSLFIGKNNLDIER